MTICGRASIVCFMSNYLILVASDPETWPQNKEKQSVKKSHIWQCCLWQILCRTRSSFESWSQSWAASWETIWLLFANTAEQFILWVEPGDWLRPQLQSVIVDTVLCAHDNVYIKGRERRPPSKQTHIQSPHPPTHTSLQWMRSTKRQRKHSICPLPFTHLQWRLRAPESGSGGPGHRCARSGRRLRKCSGGQTRTDGSLTWWPLSWTKQTASPLGRVGQPGPRQSQNRTGQPLNSQTIRIRTGTG